MNAFTREIKATTSFIIAPTYSKQTWKVTEDKVKLRHDLLSQNEPDSSDFSEFILPDQSEEPAWCACSNELFLWDCKALNRGKGSLLLNVV
jgi:hypothetical protein